MLSKSTMRRVKRNPLTPYYWENSDTWRKAVGNELGRLANRIDNQVREINTIEFIIKEEVPKVHTVIYDNFVCDYRSIKSEPYRVRLTMVGDRLE